LDGRIEEAESNFIVLTMAKKRTIRITALIILLLVIAGVIIAYRLYREQTPDIVNRKPDVSVRASELIAAFDRDTAMASRTYMDKIIEVTGTVKMIDTSGAIVLGEEGTEASVSCGLDRRHMKDYKNVQVGSIAVVQGVCSGYQKASGDDLLALLGTTVSLRSSGIKQKK
jgi:hypothetical protein